MSGFSAHPPAVKYLQSLKEKALLLPGEHLPVEADQGACAFLM